MFLKSSITTSTENYSQSIAALKTAFDECDAVVIGAGAGLSTSAGFKYSGERFLKYFSDFKKKYGFSDMYTGGFYPYDTLEENWAYWSRYIWINRYGEIPKNTYKTLLELVKDKDCFVLTTNVDHCFQRAGFDKRRLFYTQGDYGLWQCSAHCHDKTYNNEDSVRKMLLSQGAKIGNANELIIGENGLNMKIPAELVAYCPVCGKPMSMNLRCDDSFVEDEGWHTAAMRYDDFIRRHDGLNVLFLELGVGGNTPGIIKYPFWRMTAKNKNAKYACINFGEAYCPCEIRKRSVCISADINKVLDDIKMAKKITFD